MATNLRGSWLKKIGLICSIPILSFLISCVSILGFYEYCRLHLQPYTSDHLPSSLRQIGVNISVEQKPNEFKDFTLIYGDSNVKWSRNFDLLNAWGPTFVTANLDQDPKPEMILLYRSSQYFEHCQTQPNTGFNLGLPIETDFVVYDFENNKINMSCDIPKLYAMYFSERYRSFIFDGPSLILSTYVSIACTFLYLGLMLYKYLTKSQKVISDQNRKL